MIFADRRDAGGKLADMLHSYAGDETLIVLALPRGGVPVGFEIARRLKAPLDVFVVRKLGVPYQPELAMGAIASGGITVINDSVVDMLRIPRSAIDQVARMEAEELRRRERLYRGDAEPIKLSGRTVILVDDGLATGSSMKAAIRSVQQQGPAKLIVAVPVGAHSTCREIGAMVDDAVCLSTPDDFQSVGSWYMDFSQTTDEEVERLLSESSKNKPQVSH